MKNTSKILALVLVVMTVLMSLSAITASAETATVTKVFDPDELGVVSDLAGTQTAGTDGFFTLNLSKSKNEAKSKSFEDGFTSTYRFSLNGTSKIENEAITRSIGFTTPGAATVKVWWELGNAGRTLDLYGTDLTLVESIAPDATGLYISTFEVSAAGTYYLAHMAGTVYFYKVEVSWTVELCAHEGGEATCAQQAICSKCGQPYGDLTDDHNFVDGKCTVCELPDPSICNHANMAPATCLLPATCECGYTEGEALGHDIVVDPAVAPTCTAAGLEAGEHCSRCDYKVEQKEVAALGHTLTFVNTVPTLEAAGGVKAHCSVCNEDIDYGTFNVMTPGTYVLDAKELADISVSGQAYDGQVRIVGGVFACHLSAKYKTDPNIKTFAADDWTSTHRMNFGGASNFCNIGEGEDAVRNGGLRNFIQIVTTEETTITFHWVIGGDDRELGVYDMAGELVAITEEKGLKNDVVVSTVTVPAGAYIIGSASSGGGSYIFKVTVDVAAPHTHVWSDATCTEPAKCECGETQGEALGHTWVDATCEAPKSCSVCGATEGEALGHTYVDGKCACGAEDPDYVAPQPPVDEPTEEPKDEGKEEEKELNFFEKILAWFMDLINKFLALFK